MLDIEGLTNTIVKPVSLQLTGGTRAAISGPSGSGKSVLLRMIADLDPHEGTVSLDGMRRAAMTGPAWRRLAVYAAAEPGWWADHVAAHFPRVDVAKTLAARLALNPAIFGRAVAGLSTGERQRLGLIRALSANPKVLLLDEPTSALDPDTTSLAERLIREQCAGGMIVILVTHDAAQAERLGTICLAMRQGILERR